MKQKYLVGNWKMYKTVEESITFVNELVPLLEKVDTRGLSLSIAPSFVHLAAIAPLLEGKTTLQLMAQNCHHEAEGAFTGEVSASMLATIGIGGVLIGHSERRIYQQENGLLLAKKITQVLESGMQPLLCCGENLAERKQGNHQAAVRAQLAATLSLIKPDHLTRLAIAYEPVWAIGTGAVASLSAISAMHAFIGEMLLNEYGVSNIPILYGGSCNPKNAKDIFGLAEVAGGLIGGASLQIDSFIQLVSILLESK